LFLTVCINSVKVRGSDFFGACMGQKCLLWGILGHGWDTLLHMNFADFHMTWKFKSLILLKKTHALGRSLVIFKNPVSRS
ncbi:TPA: hypothetical protein ACV19N_004695, partial [Escherichia coli]|uniref:hypothetical protein n=2 Tax=Escherichia coli TaxID=562 RepID=UPI000FB82B21